MEEDRKNFISKLGIDIEGNMADDGCYIIDLNEKQFFSCESILDNSDLVELDEDSSNITYESITKEYISDDYLLTLIGDLEGDTYRLTCKDI